MSENHPPAQGRPERNLDWLLEQFVQTVPGVTAAQLATADGLKKARHGLDEDQADMLSATISGLMPLVDGALRQVTRSSRTRHQQTVTEAGDTLFFFVAAGQGTILCVLADQDSDVGAIGYQLHQLVTKVGEYLGAPVRVTA